MIALPDAASGEVVETEGSRFWRVARRLDELWKGCGELVNDHAMIFDRAAVNVALEDLHPDMAAALDSRSDGVLFMDIETTGLAGSPLFLIGLMHYTEGTFLIEQLLARDYSEEPAVLRRYHQTLRRFRVLVTFNGKTFDVPQIRDRSLATAVGFEPPDVTHVDLLHESRRRWKDKFPNCKLQTLETFICRRRREGDIPGDQIPKAYHDFVRTGDAREMKAILHHNALDLVTMAQLLVAMLQGRRV